MAAKGVYETRLENGLRIVVIHNPKGPLVYHSLWFKVGSADSPQGLSGMAHFIEHLTFKGTKKFPGDASQRNIDRIGGIQNAQTSQDNTIYWQISDKKHLPLLMEMGADRIYNVEFDEKEFEKERQVVLNERRSRVDVSSSGKASEAAISALFWNHPYGKSVIGYEHEIKNYTCENAQDFYKSWYTPSNAILIVAGDVTLQEVEELAKKYYGPLAKKEPIARNRLKEPSHHGVTSKVILRDPQTKGSFVEWVYPAPQYRSAHDNEGIKNLLALSLITRLLADPTYGSLYEILVHQQKLARHIGAAYDGLAYDQDSFSLCFSPELLLDVEKVEGIMQAMLYDMALNGPRPEQLVHAKERYFLGEEYSKRSLNGLAATIGSVMMAGFSYADLIASQEILKNLTCDDIKSAASTFLLNPPAVQVYSYPDISK